MIHLITATKKVAFIKPTLREKNKKALLIAIFKEMMSINNCIEVSSMPSDSCYRVKEQLGILETFQPLGYFEDSEKSLYYYQKCINKYLGSLRLASDALFGYKDQPQDLSFLLQRTPWNGARGGFTYITDEIPVKSESDRLERMINIAYKSGCLAPIRQDYVDFTMFLERILPLVSFDNVVQEIDIQKFESLEFRIRKPNIKLARDNTRVYELVKKASGLII